MTIVRFSKRVLNGAFLPPIQENAGPDLGNARPLSVRGCKQGGVGRKCFEKRGSIGRIGRRFLENGYTKRISSRHLRKCTQVDWNGDPFRGKRNKKRNPLQSLSRRGLRFRGTATHV